MTSYRLLDIRGGTTPGNPSKANVLAFKAARGVALHQQLLAQDRVVGSGRRVLLRSGLMGSHRFGIADVDPEDTASQIYPTATAERTVARAARVPLTPGSVVAMQVIALPSGPVQRHVGGDDPWDVDGAGGSVKLKVRYRSQTGFTKDREIDLSFPASTLTYAAQPSADSAAWAAVLRNHGVCYPADQPVPITTVERYSAPGSSVDLELIHIGSPRIVDVCVYELPFMLARRDDRETWQPAHLYTIGGDQPYGFYPSNYPQTRAGDEDPALGTEVLSKVLLEQGKQLGPTLFDWSSYVANDMSLTGEMDPVEVTSTSWVNLTRSAVTAWSEDVHGVSVGCGGYARRYRTSGWPAILRDRQGVIHTRARVYGKGKGTIRIQTKDWSYVDVPVSNLTDYEWTERLHHLCCGIHPESDTRVSLWAKADSGYTLYVRDIFGHYQPDAPAQVEENPY